MADLTHASFFSGVGGLDMGLERAGWRTVSFSEIDPYASAVLAQRWSGVPNLGSIVDLAGELHIQGPVLRRDGTDAGNSGGAECGIPAATLWTGGFPCQDLSVAGKRRGMGAGTRSGLAYSFLALAERHRPRFVLLENVPGLLSSHGGRDMAALIGALVELGYGVGYRILDARYFGVPQRRRRVFILGISPGGRAGAERAAEVLSVGSRCRRHPPTGIEAGQGVAEGTQLGVDIARAVTGTSGKRHDDDTDTLIANGLRASDGHHGYSSPRGDGGDNLVSASPDPRRVRAPDGLAGRSHDRDGVADTLRVGGRASGAGDSYDNTPWVVNALDQRRGGADDNEAQAGHLVAQFVTENQRGEVGLTDTSFSLAQGGGKPGQGYAAALTYGGSVMDDPLLPLGLDSHRYRCAGNGVVADVAEWIGYRLAAIS